MVRGGKTKDIFYFHLIMPAKKFKILLIEDDPPTIDIYEEILKKARFVIETLKWGKDALKAFDEIKKGKRKKPDLVLLDLILPDINGVEILRKVKGDKELRAIPFFVLTNYTDPQLEKEIRILKAEKYIIKTNYTPSELVKMIKDWFNSKEKSNLGQR